MTSNYQVVRTYPSRMVVAVNLTKQQATDKASIANMGSDTESFGIEKM